MATANERQIGGSHYKGSEYQHWDYAYDIKQPYHAACASKYVSRWRDKNGREDLEKAVHYIDKCVELGVMGSYVPSRHDHFWRFVLTNEIAMTDAVAIFHIQEGQWAKAVEVIKGLLAATA